MIKRYLFYFIWVVIVIMLIGYSLNYKSGKEAMLAQVESNATAISFRKAVLVKNIYVVPGQVVDSGDILIEVERPEMELTLSQLIIKRDQISNMLEDMETTFKNSKSILKAEKELEISPLLSERKETEYKINTLTNNATIIDSLGLMSFNIDTELLNRKLALIESQLELIENNYKLEIAKLENTYQNNKFQLSTDITLVDQELDLLHAEMKNFQKRADKSCTIGNVFVQLDELVPPYKTLMSLYDLNPTQIKAFVAEGSVGNIDIGANVMVESVNRDYKVEGKIVEIGSRVTTYPDKISPAMNIKFYGQEIFINIPENNKLLNGEKVYVYAIDN